MKHIGAHLLIAAGAAVLLLSACTPSLSPLYRDYAPETDSMSMEMRILAALEDAGWDTTATNLPNAVATKERVLSNWGFYKVAASLEVAPLGRDHVRLYVHPYRQYVIGSKSKILYLTRRVESRFIPELNDAFEKQGLRLAGTPFERDSTVLR